MKAFEKWKGYNELVLTSIIEKERFINNWFTAYEHNRTKVIRRTFGALKCMGSYLNKIEDAELKLRVRNEE